MQARSGCERREAQILVHRVTRATTEEANCPVGPDDFTSGTLAIYHN